MRTAGGAADRLDAQGNVAAAQKAGGRSLRPLVEAIVHGGALAALPDTVLRRTVPAVRAIP